MNLTLNSKDISKLSPSARAELAALFFPKVDFALPDGFDEDDFEDVVDLTPDQVREFVLGCSDMTVAGLRLFAQHGPSIKATLLEEAGFENLGSFQGAVTKRARTVTKNRSAFLLAYDDWSEHDDGVGLYAVTQTTFRSLKAHFGID